MKSDRTTRKTRLAAAVALCLAAAQTAPAHTFRERIAEGGVLSADDIDSAFSKPQDLAWYDRFSFGSYGEAHFNTGDVSDKFDIHRLVLFTAYEFSSRFRFVSEIELEHLYSNDPGTDLVWELEQAYFEYDLENDYHLQGGLLLVPLGITNEIHEPTTFYGVERNRVETEIIPSTWTELGFLLRKDYDSGLQWDLAVHRGLQVDDRDFNRHGPDLRNGRQKKNTYDSLGTAATARVRYTGINGLELAAGIQYQDDVSVGREDNSAILTTAHFIYTNGGFGLRGLVANWDISGNTAIGGVAVPGSDIDNQYGAYIEPSYKWTFENGMALGLFTRYLYFENEDAPGGQTEYQAGVNFWPTENTVVKADWVHEDRANGRGDQNVLNFGVGYAF
ncbi:porin [Akkermansiaceae bacterium]|nr:porin [Akkermansiaceae bacterium]